VTAGERYRAKAFELFARADVESSPFLSVEFDDLAAAYLRLAEQAAQNDALIVKFELPSKVDSGSNAAAKLYSRLSDSRIH